MINIERHPLGFYIASPSGPPSKFAPPETLEQQAFVKWLRKSKIRHHSVPNGAATSKEQGVLLKKEGLVRGVPDLFVYYNRRTVIIEMKKANGKYSDFSPEQIDWMTFLASPEGGSKLVIGAMGFNAAREALQKLAG